MAKFEQWSYTEKVFESNDVTIHARPGVVQSKKTWVSPVVPTGGLR